MAAQAQRSGVAELPFCLIVAGPTTSGKSALALGLAGRLGGAVINADAMQCYRDLRVLTARPTPEEETRAPHRLYGTRGAAERVDAAWWREAALGEMRAARAAGRLPILCGGTGMYLAALRQGIAPIPPIPAAAREEARGLLERLGAAGLHAELARVDPAAAARLRPSDSQRLARAFEVWRATGRSILAWQAEKGAPAPWRFAALVLDPPREALREAAAARFAAMLEAGAVEEVRALCARDLPPDLPLLRAHGVPELSAFLRGEIPLAEAAARAVRATGQYTRRQATWLRHHELADPRATHTIYARVAGLEQFMQSEMAAMMSIIRREG
jgi:tRNA dimethylallyltransferase